MSAVIGDVMTVSALNPAVSTVLQTAHQKPNTATSVPAMDIPAAANPVAATSSPAAPLSTQTQAYLLSAQEDTAPDTSQQKNTSSDTKLNDVEWENYLAFGRAALGFDAFSAQLRGESVPAGQSQQPFTGTLSVVGANGTLVALSDNLPRVVVGSETGEPVGAALVARVDAALKAGKFAPENFNADNVRAILSANNAISDRFADLLRANAADPSVFS